MGLGQFDERRAYNTVTTIDASSGTAAVNIVSGQFIEPRWDSLLAINNDVIDHHVRVLLSPFNYNAGDLGVVLVPAGAGYTTGPPIDLLFELDPRHPYLVLERLDTISVAVEEAVTLTNHVQVIARGGLL